jgi:hypothetical protein
MLAARSRRRIFMVALGTAYLLALVAVGTSPALRDLPAAQTAAVASLAAAR